MDNNNNTATRKHKIFINNTNTLLFNTNTHAINGLNFSQFLTGPMASLFI